MTVSSVTIGIPTYNRSALLRESIESVLAQSHSEFRLLICDNASEDDTADMVTSIGDGRIDYRRWPTNIGMVGNVNRVIELTETPYLVVLPDDDVLYPDYLRVTVPILAHNSEVGVVHTAFDLIDASSRTRETARSLVALGQPVEFETGSEYLERSMRSSWTICWPTALFRREAVTFAGGLRANEEPLVDFPFFMRIALQWDFAAVARSLVGLRLHAESATAAIGSYVDGSYDLLDNQARILHDHRTRFLDMSGLPDATARHYRTIADRALSRDIVHLMANRAGAGLESRVMRDLFALIRDDPSALTLPSVWRLIAAQCGGRQLTRLLARITDLRDRPRS